MSENRVVIVTGTSSGIGLATAVGSARAGFTVVATVRDPGGTEALTTAAAAGGATLDIRRLDVTDAVSVGSLVAGVVESYGRIDALVNNAGAAHLGTVELDTMEGIRGTLEVNFFGVVAMTREVMPYLRASGGRVVTISSVGGVVGQPFNEAYCAAKFAVEGFMEGLAPVAATVGVRVVVVEPGAVASAFVTNAGVDPQAAVGQAGPYAPALMGYLERTAGAFTAAQSSEDAAAVVVSTLTQADVPFRVQTSETARTFVGLKLLDLDGSRVQTATGAWVNPS